MNVTIIGTGSMARAIGTRVLAGGHGLTLLGTTREKADELAGELRAVNPGATVSTGVSGDPIADDVVVLALWYQPARDVVEQNAGGLAGKVVIDVSNPVDPQTYDRLITPPDSSAAEELSALAPGARVVKAFNTTFAGTLAAGEVAGQPLDVFLAGDDADAKTTVATLATDGGLRPVDVGGLDRARYLEGLGFVHITIQEGLGTGYGSALKVLA